jgi:hypothetical protein
MSLTTLLTPPSRVLQHHFRDLLRQPRGEIPLPHLCNRNDYQCGIKRLIIAYHHPPNLSDILVPRKIDKTKGPPVSAYVNPFLAEVQNVPYGHLLELPFCVAPVHLQNRQYIFAVIGRF